MNVYGEARRERQYLQRLEQKYMMLLDKSMDYRQLYKEIDYDCKYSTQTMVEVVRILCDIRKAGLYDQKKVQKVINHYAIEYDNMIVLKR